MNSAATRSDVTCTSSQAAIIPLLVSTILVILLAAWLRFPYLSAGMPYFYDEDEGHHYNRVVNMVKQGEFNPKYFLKPSLHFYVRMPVTAFAFLQAVRDGELRALKDIQTKDQYGLAGYSFSASHPKIVKYNRAFSVACSLIAIALVGGIAIIAGLSLTAAVGAMLLTAISPALVANNAVIGVDVIVTPLVLGSVLCALLAYRSVCRKKDPLSLEPASCGVTSCSTKMLFLSAILAGLATSTKYNAAIAILIPLFTALLCCRLRLLIPLFLTSIAAFVLGTPYLFAELPLFLDHVAFELWHYGIAGHVGNEGQPGWSQAVYYTSWLSREGVGLLPLVCLAAGAVITLVRARSITSNQRAMIGIISLFAIIYFAFMCSQKANFVRNMFVIIPFIALGFAASISAIGATLPRFGSKIIPVLIAAAVVIPLAGQTFPERQALDEIEESRLTLADWMFSSEGVIFKKKRIGIAGELQIQRNTLPSDLNITRYIASEFRHWGPANADIAILPENQEVLVPGWVQLAAIDGAPLPMRIVKNPAFAIWVKVSSLEEVNEPHED